MFGTAIAFWVVACCAPDPQPILKRRVERLAPVAITFDSLHKFHPASNTLVWQKAFNPTDLLVRCMNITS